MEQVLFTQLTTSEVRQLLRLELEAYFSSKDDPQSADNSNMLDVPQAAALLMLSVPTLYSLVSKRLIPVCKRGKRLYFSKEELIEWVRAGRKSTLEELKKEAGQTMLAKNIGR